LNWADDKKLHSSKKMPCKEQQVDKLYEKNDKAKKGKIDPEVFKKFIDGEARRRAAWRVKAAKLKEKKKKAEQEEQRLNELRDD
jgi:hypothetical protein